MKRVAAILILGILLFNWCGYRFLTSYMEEKSNKELENQLDVNDYDESELITIKVSAVHLGYYTNSKEFERVDGHIEIDGVQYKYVKRRLYQDSLELMCLPNHEAMRFQSAKDEFFKLVNDLQHAGQGKKGDSHPGSSKNFSISCYIVTVHFNLRSPYLTDTDRSSYYSFSLPSFYSSPSEQPPDYSHGLV